MFSTYSPSCAEPDPPAEPEDPKRVLHQGR